MWRSRARVGLCAIVAALAWTAAPSASASPSASAAPSASAPDGTGTMMVGPTAVQASQVTTLTFTYTAEFLEDGTITLVVPTGWTPPSQTPGPGYTTVSCPMTIYARARACQLTASPATMTITIKNVNRNVDLGRTVVITYQMAQAPASAGTSTFTAAEQSFAAGALAPLGASPAVAVTCPDGAGTMAVSPLTTTASSTAMLTFSYTAGSCGVQPGGVVTLTVPGGWTPPDTVPGTPGFAVWAGGAVSVSAPMTIVVPVGTLLPVEKISFDYEMAKAPGSPGGYTFAATEESGAGGSLQPLAASSAITVTPPVVTSSSPSSGGVTSSSPSSGGGTSSSSTSGGGTSSSSTSGGAGTMTVAPAQVTAARQSTLRFTYTAPETGLSPSGEVTVHVPAGWAAPSRTPGRAGYASSSGGNLSVSGRAIAVTGVALRGGQQLTITYAAGPAPGAAGVSTFVTSQRPDGTATLAALAVSPSVTVGLSTGPGDGLAIVLVVAALVVVAGAASLLASRLLHRGGHGTGGGNVSAVPHTGPPPSAAVRDTGNRPTLTVRLEPHADATVTTIDGRRP